MYLDFTDPHFILLAVVLFAGAWFLKNGRTR